MTPVLRMVSALGPVCHDCAAPIAAAARYCSQCGCSIAAARAQGRALTERRHVSIAFYDLIGSAALATTLDVEDYSELIRNFHHQISSVMTRFGGFVARYLGDGALIYFGYPHAREDDALQAVRAGLAAIESLRHMPGDHGRLHMRVGISAGVTIVGDVLCSGSPFDVDVAGETPNLAARLQALAEPDTVMIDDGVRRTVDGRFDCRDCGTRVIRGWPEPVQLWQVLRPAQAGSRLQRRVRGETGRLVGRDVPAARMLELWQQACSGVGQVVLLTGEAGLGKSRLVEHLLDETVATRHTRLRYFGAPHQQDVPLYPVIAQIEHSAAFDPGDDTETRRTKLISTRQGASSEELQLIRELVIPPAQGSAPQLELRLKRERTLQALLNPLVAAARRKPMLVVVEDAHWIDPSSAEMLERLVRLCAELPMLMIVTARPEYQPDWAGWPQVECVTLEPLAAADSAEIVRRVAEPTAVPPNLMDEILARSDGVPLFLEEVTKAALEIGVLSELSRGRRAEGSAVPITIRASLLGRLDRLGDARELAEIAAVIGRDFNLDMLALVAEQPATALAAGLERLTESGLVQPRGAPGSGQYRFKHALIQDTAYDMMLRDQRRRLHGRIADALEHHLPEVAASQPQLLARHCMEAGFAVRAIDWWLRAGTQSLLRSAATEALAQLESGLRLARGLPDTEDTLRRQLDLSVIKAKTMMLVHGQASPEVGKAYADARTLCTELNGPPQLPMVLFGQTVHHLMGRRLGQAQGYAAELLALAEVRGDPDWIVTGCYATGFSAFPAGRFGAVRANLERGLALFDPAKRALYTGPGIGDPAVLMRIYLSWSLMCQGELAEARRLGAEALAEARHVGPTWTILQALWHMAYLDLQLGSGPDELHHLEELRSLSDAQGRAYYGSLAQMLRGVHAGTEGRSHEGLDLIQRGLALHLRSGGALYEPSLIRFEAEMLGQTGAFEAGLNRLAAARRIVEKSGTRWDEADMLRTRAGLRAGLGDRRGAETDLRQALQVARAQGAQFFEVRAATALAAILDADGRRADAGQMLDPLVAGFYREPDAEELWWATRLAREDEA